MSHLPACTIASNNYLAFARVLAASYEEHHPGAPVFVCVVDRPHPSIDYAGLPFTCVFAEELGIPRFENFAFRYDVLELNTAVKPFFLAHLRDHHGLDRVLYFDPDILIHDTLTGIEAALERHTALLTPHVTQPLDNEYNPAERKIIMVGVYNLGFLGIRLDRSTADFLTWWQERLHRYCLIEPHEGLFVDQLWMTLAPSYLDDVGVLRDPIYNVAYWNLPHRHPRDAGSEWQVDGRRVGFFHFSGLEVGDLDAISRHQNRLRPGERPELLPLFEAYRDRVFTAGHGQLRYLPYGFARFSKSEIAIPALARRILQRVDPEARRWPDPFELVGGDSFFGWLVEPLDFPLGYLNRAVLALWEERPDLVRKYPNPCGEDLESFVYWLHRQREAGGEILPAVILEKVKAKLPAPPVDFFNPMIPPRDVGRTDTARELYLAVNLRRPGEMLEWLNEPLPGRRQERPVLTRAALLVHALREDVRQLYPDPLGRDQVAFAYWYCHTGAGEFALAPELVAPVLRSLPWRNRLGLALRRGASPPPAAEKPVPAAPEPAADHDASPVAPSARQRPGHGVNLVAYFETGDARATLARGSLAALRRAGFAAASIPVDQDLWGRIVRGRILQPQGAPYDVTLVQVALQESGHALGMLPVSATAAGIRIGFWFWDLAYLPLQLAHYFGSFNEIWAPSRFCAEAFAILADVAVRQVPPCVPRPAVTPDRKRHGLDEGKFYCFASVDARGLSDLDNPLAAVATIRRLHRHGDAGLALLLRVEHAAANPRLVDALRKESRGLPVVVHTDPATPAAELLATCDAFLSLHRGGGLNVPVIEALYLEKPVVATAYGSVADVLDAASGYPVRYAPGRTKDHLGPYAAGSVWARPDLDHAAEQIERLLNEPGAAAQRAAAGRQRAEEIYGVDAAARRFGAELARVLET